MNEEFYKSITRSVTKSKANYTIDTDLLKEFDEICKNRKLKKSQVVQKFIEAFVEQEKKN